MATDKRKRGRPGRPPDEELAMAAAVEDAIRQGYTLAGKRIDKGIDQITRAANDGKPDYFFRKGALQVALKALPRGILNARLKNSLEVLRNVYRKRQSEVEKLNTLDLRALISRVTPVYDGDSSRKPLLSAELRKRLGR